MRSIIMALRHILLDIPLCDYRLGIVRLLRLVESWAVVIIGAWTSKAIGKQQPASS